MPPLNDDALLTQLYDEGDRYDRPRQGPRRSLHIQRDVGRWCAEWKNGPFDSAKLVAEHATVLGAVRALTLMLLLRNQDEDAAE